MGRVIASAARGERPRRDDVLLGLYSVANVAVCVALVSLSMVLWFELFGGLLTSMWSAGPVGLVGLALAAILLLRPALVPVLPGLLAAVATGRRTLHQLRFRRSIPWRRAAMAELRRTVPALAALDQRALNIAAGLLTRIDPDRPGGSGLLVVRVPPVSGARRGVVAALDPDLLRRRAV